MTCTNSAPYCPFNCVAGSLSSCTGRLGPTFNGPTIAWPCPVDVSGAKGVVQKLTVGASNDGTMSCVENVICSTGTPVPVISNGPMPHPNQAGDCTNNVGGGTTVVDCSPHGGLHGFSGNAQTNNRILGYTAACTDTVQIPTVVNKNTGTSVPLSTCPPTHFVSKISAETVNNAGAVALTYTCDGLDSFCKGNNLLTETCFTFCSENLGTCDAALLAFCSDPANFTEPICGCALPPSEYASNDLQSQGISIPVACDKRCQGTSVIKLANTGTCNIGTVCVQSGTDITVIQSQLGSGITLEQNCSSGGGGGTSSGSISPTTLFFIIAGTLVLLVVVLVIAILLAGASRRSSERRLQALT